MKTDFDVIVIGGGPAGGLAALTLAAAGIKAALLEKEKFPRYKTCGGGLVQRAVEQIPFDISNSVSREFYQIQIIENEFDLKFAIESDSPVIRTVMRADFDQLLVRKAASAGCEIFDGFEVTDLEISDENVAVRSGGEKYTAKYLVASDGAFGITARVFRNLRKYKNVPALEYEISPKGDSRLNLFESARFDFGVIPEGYGWVFPKREHLSIGIASMSNGRVNLKKHLSDYLLKLGVDTAYDLEKHGYVIPMRTGSLKSSYKNKVFFCGDAAALADPVTAEGISNALLSGNLAAESIIAEFDSPGKAANLYEKELSVKIIRELKFAKLLSAVFYRQNRIRKYLLKNHGQRMAELMIEVVSGRAKYSELLIRTSNYLKLLRRTKK